MRKKVISLFCAILLMPVASAHTNLSENGAANSYVVSECGKYSFKAVKGNGECPVRDVFSCEVLWESFGTSESPVPGELIYDVSCDKDYVYMTVPEPFRRGNAVIAAKDKSGNILWSWHIWLTDKPDGLELVNGDVIMDRNIGAVSTDASSAESYGLLYQWGRKDPFPGTSVRDDKTPVATTVEWPAPQKSDEYVGTIDYAVAHPLTFITYNILNYDWQYVQDDTRWGEIKSVYDPCPQGWKVPSNCFGGVTSYFEHPFSGVGIDFCGKFSFSENVWFPATGYRYYYDGTLFSPGLYGSYWLSGTEECHADYMFFYFSSGVYPRRQSPRANAYSVRCVAE